MAMIQQPISTPPKEFVQQRQEAQPPASSPIDFTQLIDGGLLSLGQNGSSSDASQNSSPTEWWKQKSDKSDSNTSNLAAASAVTAPAQNATQSTSSQTPAQGSTPSPVTAQGAASNALEPAGATAANTASNGGTQAPPGAAALEARIAAGAPTYLSQPNAVLAGLWHHANDAQPAAPAAGQANADGASTQDGTDAAGNPADPSQKTATLPQLATEAAQAAAAANDGSHSNDGTSGQGVAAAANQANPNPTVFALPGADAQQTASLPTQTSTATPTPAPTPMPAQIIPAAEQIALSMRQAAQTNTGRIEIQLKPASLGAIDVKLDVTHDGRITAVISADRSDTLQMLRQDSAGLQQALRNAGLQADSGSLSFNLRGGGQQSYSQNSSSGGSAPSYASAAAAPRSSLQVAQSYLRRHAGSLDIEV